MRRKPTMASSGIPATADPARAVLNVLGDERGVLNSPGFLRLEAKLGQSQSITFNMIENQGTATVTEKRLKITDIFVALQLGFFIFKVPKDAKTTLGKLRTFANPTVFSAATEADRINAVWESGQLTIVKNSIQNVPALDLERFRSVGVAMEGLTVGATNAYFADERRDAKVGFINLTPILTFQGADNVQLTINLPESLDLQGDGSDNYAVLYFRGFLRQNASFIGKKNKVNKRPRR